MCVCVLQDFQKDNLRCEFNIDTGKTVPATVTALSDNRVIIECNRLTVSYMYFKWVILAFSPHHKVHAL